jgi:hypothetical protein
VSIPPINNSVTSEMISEPRIMILLAQRGSILTRRVERDSDIDAILQILLPFAIDNKNGAGGDL